MKEREYKDSDQNERRKKRKDVRDWRKSGVRENRQEMVKRREKYKGDRYIENRRAEGEKGLIKD